MKRFFYVLFCLILASCGDSSSPPSTESSPLFQNADFQELHDFADRRDGSAVLDYFDHEDPRIRQQACLVAGSMQDSLLLPGLFGCLKDSSASIRKYAAWAIGQTGNASTSGKLRTHLEFEFHPEVRYLVFEAYAKCLPTDSFQLYFSEPPSGSDIESWLRGVYQLTLRDRSWTGGPDIIPFFAHPLEEVRLICSHILSRSGRELSDHEAAEIELRMMSEASENVRMAMISALRKSRLASTGPLLQEYVLDESAHPGVRVNAIRSLRALNVQVPPGMVAFLDTDNRGLAEEVAQWMMLFPASVEFALERGLDKAPASVQALLLSEAMRNEGIAYHGDDYLDLLQAQTERYHKMSFIAHLPENQEMATFASQALDTCRTEVLLTAFAEAISRWDLDRQEHQILLKKLIKIGDAGAVALMSETLVNPAIRVDDETLSLLDSVRQQLVLPREVETYNAICAVLKRSAQWENLETHTPGFNHPINWSRARNLGEEIRVRIMTTKGEIMVELLPNLAPATVLDFFSLCEDGFYNAKSFHRVVPNFVIQGGCPRGDGYGSMDYSIRSEFSPLSYATGTLGMASAGRDTESCQWFITQSPTPHLEGRYTAFGRVIKGMDVVWAIQVGDEIRSMELID